MRYLAKPTYKVRIKIALTKTVLHPKTDLVDTAAGTNLMNEDYLNPAWKCSIERLESSKLRTATNVVIKAQGVTPFLLHIGDVQARVCFRFVQNLALNMLLGTMYIDKGIRGIFCMERKIVLEHSVPVALWKEVLRPT